MSIFEMTLLVILIYVWIVGGLMTLHGTDMITHLDIIRGISVNKNLLVLQRSRKARIFYIAMWPLISVYIGLTKTKGF